MIKQFINKLYILLFFRIFILILRLILLPYFSRVLGPENYGLLSILERSTLLFGMFIDFGLSTISNKKMAINIEDLERKKDIFSQTVYTRFFMWIISGIIFIFLLLTKKHLII